MIGRCIVKVPKGSILYIKEEPQVDKPLSGIYSYCSRGMKREVIDKIVDDYGLDRIYDIRRKSSTNDGNIENGI